MPHDFVDKMNVHICFGYQVFGGRMDICFHDTRFPFGGFNKKNIVGSILETDVELSLPPDLFYITLWYFVKTFFTLQML